MYDKCYFCLDQLPKLKKESTASFFVNFGRSRGTKEPTYITVVVFKNYQLTPILIRLVSAVRHLVAPLHHPDTLTIVAGEVSLLAPSHFQLRCVRFA